MKEELAKKLMSTKEVAANLGTDIKFVNKAREGIA